MIILAAVYIRCIYRIQSHLHAYITSGIFTCMKMTTKLMMWPETHSFTTYHVALTMSGISWRGGGEVLGGGRIDTSFNNPADR